MSLPTQPSSAWHVLTATYHVVPSCSEYGKILVPWISTSGPLASSPANSDPCYRFHRPFRNTPASLFLGVASLVDPIYCAGHATMWPSAGPISLLSTFAGKSNIPRVDETRLQRPNPLLRRAYFASRRLKRDHNCKQRKQSVHYGVSILRQLAAFAGKAPLLERKLDRASTKSQAAQIRIDTTI